MTIHALFLVFSYSILLAAIVGMVRYHKVTHDNWPFFYIAWVALINEILSETFTSLFHSTAVNCNIYVLVEALLYCWLFHNWGSGFRDRKKFFGLLVVVLLFWIWDNIVAHPLTQINSPFRIFSSFILVFLAIDQINQLIVRERSMLVRNARFLISAGVVIYFTYRAIFEVFYWIGVPFSPLFFQNVYLIMVYVNLFVNLIFALAALWIPTRQKFILPS